MGMSIPNTTLSAHSQPAMAAKGAAKPNDFSFWDLLDVVNPLQHIPVVGNIYRQITGDHLGGFARIAGGAMFGGVLGVASGVANAVYAQKHGGQDFGDVALAKLTGTEIATAKPLEVAVKPVPKPQRFPDVINVADIIWDNEKAPSIMPPKLALNADTPVKNSDEVGQTDISLAMANALAKYEKTKTIAQTIVPAKHN